MDAVIKAYITHLNIVFLDEYDQSRFYNLIPCSLSQVDALLPFFNMTTDVKINYLIHIPRKAV